MWGLPQKQNARRAYKIRICGHLRRYKKIVKKTYMIYYKYLYSKTYTLCRGLNSVLFVWVRKKIRRNIYKKKGWQHEHFLNAFFINSQRPVVDCLTVAAGILARSEGVIKGTGANQRFVKNAFKNAECHPFFLINISSYLLSDSYMTNTTFKSDSIVSLLLYDSCSYSAVIH